LPSFRNARRVGHRADQMFDLVADIERYPEFVPLCQSLRVKRRLTDPSGAEILIADMKIGFHAIRESFTSRVTLERGQMKIRVEYIDGPFSHLENVWTFTDEDDGGASRVEFFIDYEFRNSVLGALMGSMFDVAFKKFADAFAKRADKVYGTGTV
jgi:coenzyme Q-binding protein COQ10